MQTKPIITFVFTTLGIICLANPSLCQPHQKDLRSEIEIAYHDACYAEVIKRGMPFLRKIALQHPSFPAVNLVQTEILVLKQSSRKVTERMERIQALLQGNDEGAGKPIQNEIKALQIFIAMLRELEGKDTSSEIGETPRLSRSDESGGEGPTKEEQAILNMLVDSTRRVKDGVVFDEYSRITARLDNGLTAKRKDGKTTRREGHGGEQGESGNGLTMLRDYVFAYLALTRSLDVLVKTINWMPDSLKGPEQLLDFVDLCSRLKEQDSAIALCEDIANRFYGEDTAADALQKQAEICVALKRFDEAVAADQQIIDMYASDGGSTNLSVSGETSYKFSHRLLKARYEIIKIYGHEMKMYPAAIRECEKLIDAFPDTEAAVYAEYLIGQFLYQNQEYAKGAKAFQKYVGQGGDREVSNLVEAKLLLALSYMGQQKEDDAVAVLGRIVAEHPSNKLAPKARFLLGYCFLTRQRYAEAREEFKKLLEKYPGSKYDRQAADYVEKLKGVQLPNHNDQ